MEKMMPWENWLQAGGELSIVILLLRLTSAKQLADAIEVKRLLEDERSPGLASDKLAILAESLKGSGHAAETRAATLAIKLQPYLTVAPGPLPTR